MCKENKNNEMIFEINSKMVSGNNNSPAPQDILRQIKEQEEEK